MSDNDLKDAEVKAAELAAKAAEKLAENKGLKGVWSSSKDKAVRYLGALVFEKDKTGEWVISIGRVSWWMTFLPALYIFIAAFQSTSNVTEAAEMVPRDITPNHLTVLLTLAGYNFGKKVAEVVTKVWGKSDGPG